MKIDFLQIRSKFKNLDGVRIDFDEKSLMTVIVGRNGSGKSNVLEALVSIFRNLDLGEAPRFSYVIRYKLGQADNECWIQVDADPGRDKPYQITAEQIADQDRPGTDVSLAKVRRSKLGKSDYLPKYLFAYYSGPSDRLEGYFRKHRTDFYRKLLESEVDLGGEIRPLFYAKPVHSQFVLLAFFLSGEENTERQFLRDHLGIEDLDSVHFVMRKPDWVKSAQKKDRFWGAEGVVRDFLETLYPLALAPLRIVRPEDTSLTGKRIRNEFIHLFLPDVLALRSFSKGLTQDVFFKMLESTLLSEIISAVSVRVKVRSSDDALSFRELSEGEQQLLTVLGLLKFTGGKDSLFLLDEPDTHLNPAWAVKYLSFLRMFVPNAEASHLLMVTHHQLAIAELERGQVQVMWRDQSYSVHANEPAESPRGLGYSGILTSDMFGLRTTLDAPTESKIRERQSLLEKDKLTPVEKVRLAEIDKEIEALGFTTSHWDADYQEYLRERKKFENEPSNEREDPVANAKRKAIARRVVSKIVEEERGGDEGNRV